MRRARELLRDERTVKLHYPQLRQVSSPDFVLAQKVSAIANGDTFSVSQYLFGLDYFRARLRAVFPGHGGALLDFGCGAGNWSIAAADLFDTIVGVEARASRIAIAAEIRNSLGIPESRVRFVCEKGATLPYPDASFDNCLCYNVLPYVLGSREALLRELRRVTKSGGRLYLSAADLGVFAQLIPASPAGALRAAVRLALHALGTGVEPLSRLSRKYVVNHASRAGWHLLSDALEADLGTGTQPAIYPRYGFGQPFMREYLFVAP